MAQEKRIKVDVEKVRKAIESGIPLTVTTYTLPHEIEEYACDILKTFLTELDQAQMADSLIYCLKELANNGKKANTKRVYFEEKGLDINDKADYELGMKNFKMDTMSNINYYLNQQKDKGLYIKISMQTRNNKIKVEVRNRVELTNFEYKRIHDKITRAQMYNSVEEGIASLLDDSEGAGLGLVIMILVLKKIGVTEENYQVISENGETITRMILPFSGKSTSDITDISSEFVKLIDGLPEFPENITEINRIINDPNSQMSDIALKISNDVSLTTELLKLVNSAAFSLSTPCHSIGDAVKLVGLRGIKNLLYSIGSMKALTEDSNEEIKALWTHAYRIAFYSYNLARNFLRTDKKCVDDSYVCGLLHDMGKIIFETAHPEVLDKISTMCEERGVSKNLFERMFAGVNHGDVGSLIAKKWNFPEVIINAIRYHHDPLSAPEEFRKITTLIYFADMLSHYSEGNFDYSLIEPSALKMFGITSEEALKVLADKLDNSFKKEQH